MARASTSVCAVGVRTPLRRRPRCLRPQMLLGEVRAGQERRGPLATALGRGMRAVWHVAPSPP